MTCWMTFVRVTALCVLSVGLSVGALAQTTETPTLDVTVDEPGEESVSTDWQPGDGRPDWSIARDPDAGWQPGDGRPPWAKAYGTEMGDRMRTEPPGLERRIEAQVNRPATITRGRGRGRGGRD